MATVGAESKPKLLQYLKRLAPFSIVDKGISFALDGRVVECGKVNSTITAVVRADQDEDFSVALEVVSASRVEANCRCSSREEMEEQWCPHSVAVLWRASDLGFFEAHSGFATTESAFRINTSSPEDIATVLGKLSLETTTPTVTPKKQPQVDIILTPSGDRLGLKVLFDGELQEPHLFESFTTRSSRTLDNLLLQILEDSGSWDEESKIWLVNSSSHIDSIVGLINEYENVRVSSNNKKLVLPTEELNFKITIEWQESAAELVLQLVMPDGNTLDKTQDLIGTGPYWYLVDNQLFKVSQAGAMLAALFPHSPRLTIPKRKMGAILEIIDELQERYLHIINPKQQPKTAIKTPIPEIEFWAEEDHNERNYSGTNKELEISASVEFQYPTPPKGQNIVYLPNRQQEAEWEKNLSDLGFYYSREKRRYIIKGDNALDLLQTGKSVFPNPWKVKGLEAIQQQIKFANLQLNVSVTKDDGKDGIGKIDSRPIDWFHCKISLTQNNANVPLSTLFRIVRSGADRWIKLDSGAYAKVPAGGLSRLQATLGFLDPNFKLSNTIKTKLRPAQALGLLNADDDCVEFLADKQFTNLAERIKSFAKIETIQQPKIFKGKLRSYQLDGTSWMNFLHKYDLGGILADEMGLGKTVQTLAFLQYLKEGRSEQRNLNKPALIVAPTSVIINWMYEAERFTPQLSVLLLHGVKRRDYFSDITKHDLVITSYALLRNDRQLLQEIDFSYVVLDEAQNIKNPSAATTQAAKALSAEHRLCLTGTPTENRPLELWSIFDFLMPGYLGSSEFFKNQLEKPILEGTDKGQKTAELLAKKTKPFVMRRLKRDVEKDLPNKIESDLHVPMTPSQAGLYRQILDEVRPQVFAEVDKKGVRGAGVSILAALLRLRQVCNHPNSIDGLQDIDGFDSGKFEHFKEVVSEALEAGRKILVFSQFREMLRLIREFLNSIEAKHLYLDGATKDRQSLVDQFNSDEDVRLFVISLKAGGTGLNLTAADTVIIYDPWWNPAVESQAVDRAHRIGQKKSVTVYRMVTEDSIEQKIMQLKVKKKKITDVLLQEGIEGGGSPLNLTREELEDLFRMPVATEDD